MQQSRITERLNTQCLDLTIIPIPHSTILFFPENLLCEMKNYQMQKSINFNWKNYNEYYLKL